MTNQLRFFFCTILLFFNVVEMEAYMNHQETIAPEWREDNLPPFTELMISWNAPRPVEGKYRIYVSVKTNDWSPYLLYALWGSEGQTSFKETVCENTISVYQDALEITGTKKATGFQIKIVSEGDASIDCIHGLHVYTNSDASQEIEQTFSSPVYLPVAGLSQITLKHARCTDLCSPTSTTAIVRYLSKNPNIDPILFATGAWDAGFDIYGNWVFNVAQAATELGPAWNCWVERLKGFDAICGYLHRGTPVIVSIRGPLPGSAKPYAKGHLVAVIGYDPEHKKVICMDPAFPSDDQTIVRYDSTDFIQAWGRRGNTAYVFSRK
jgi:hypothetical protein